ncbi:MAG: PqqD family peptide modification chaperone [Candidatus Thermoplasmatota archaeon]|nr:PqqD family peptide modification chaperone [Candidatus Thermoplasmatota archaeon]MBU4255625.1 PqqD family peptide modification chaperone [Candidatus Thermoplasmatota archaeon]MCG2825687.1 PqqD family peptide modification chaperone [Thermoplasmatales archaeon]
MITNPNVPTWVVINPTTLQILNLCDGKTTIKKIVKNISEMYKISTHKIRKDILHAINTLVENKIIFYKGQLDAVKKHKTKKKIQLQCAHLYLEITSKCNLRCKHCYLPVFKQTPNNLTLEEITRVVHDFSEIGGKYITITGGEPLLHPDWYKIADICAQSRCSVTLLTNGTLLNKNVVSHLYSKNLFIGVSIGGASARTQDYIHGKGSFKKTLKGIDQLLSVYDGSKVAICFTPMRHNLKDIPKLFEFASQRNIGRLHFSLLEKRGRAKAYERLLNLTEKQKITLFKMLYCESLKYGKQIQVDISQHPNLLTRFAGKTIKYEYPLGETLYITSSGDVFPSAYIENQEFLLGNIRSTSIKRIITTNTFKNMFVRWGRRIEKIPACRMCSYKVYCGGGSGALALSQYGTPLIPDEYCHARQELFNYIVERAARKWGLINP